jgi:Outer membrane protein beta-barrel domain
LVKNFNQNQIKMIKQIVVVLLLVSNVINAQIKFGVKGGLNMTDASLGVNFKGNIETENTILTIGDGGSTSNNQITTEAIDQSLYVTTSPKASFFIGGFMELPINKKGNLALKTELIYCQNGTTIDKKSITEEEGIFYTSEGATYNVGQINVPILLKFTTSKKIAFHAGGYFGAILLAKGNGNSGLSADLKSRFKTFDLGLNFGASYPITKNLAAAITYNRGLLNIDKFSDSEGPITAQGLYYNRTFHVGLEYLF